MNRRPAPIGTVTDYPDNPYGVHGHFHHVGPTCHESNKTSALEEWESRKFARKLLSAIGGEFQWTARSVFGGASFTLGPLQGLDPRVHRAVGGQVTRLAPGLSRRGAGSAASTVLFWDDFSRDSRQALKIRNALTDAEHNAYHGDRGHYPALPRRWKTNTPSSSSRRPLLRLWRGTRGRAPCSGA